MNAVSATDQFPVNDMQEPRFRAAGDLTLDLMHRDGRIDDRWLALHPREFALLWRLAQAPASGMSRQQSLDDVQRVHLEPESTGLALLVARLRGKLEPFGLAPMLASHPEGGYFLDVPPADSLSVFARRRAG